MIFPTNPGADALLPFSSDPASRLARTLDMVIDSLELGRSPRYQARDLTGDGVDETFCNIALWDFSRAMTCEIPHWALADGSIARPNAKNARELRVDDTLTWLDQHGRSHGFMPVSYETARVYALAGRFASVWWRNPNPKRSGHVAFFRSNGAEIAQAGRSSFGRGTIAQGFGSSSPLVWWVHD
jgi:hypothetical protein